MRQKRIGPGFLCVCATWLAWPAIGLAGPVEQAVQVALDPSDPNLMTVRYTWGGDGMLRTNDAGKSWQLLCDSALFDTSSTRSGPIAIVGDGTTFMGIFSGLYHDDGHGCSWQSVAAYDGQWLGDLAQHPSDPSVLFAVTSNASTPTEKKLNGVIRRDADGSWHDVGEKAELLATRLHVVPLGTGLRFYMGAIEGQVTPPDGGALAPNYVTRVSDDEGATWREYVYGTTDGTLRIQAVDPTNPDRIVASINRSYDTLPSGDDTVLVSRDQGAHFERYLTISEIGGVVFTPDGKLFIGDAGDSTDPTRNPGGLWIANSLDETPAQLPNASYPVQCLGYQAQTGKLFACQHFWFGEVDLRTGTFSSLVKFTDVAAFVSCPGVDMAMTCKTQLCNAYCGFGHFAVAPVCAIYHDDSCGGRVAAIELGKNPDGSTTPTTSADAGVNAASAMSTPPAPVSSIPSAARAPAAKARGCSAGGPTRAPDALVFLSAIGLAALARIRRSRSRA